MEKLCTSCRYLKNVSEFYSKGKSGQSQHICKKCYNNYCMDRWSKRKSEAVASKGGICEMCKTEYPDCVFDFHHKEPSEKEYSWPKMRQLPVDKMNKELDKCVLLCANCHRIHHWAIG